MPFTKNGLNMANLVGIIPGNDPELKDEYILLGAHFDHIGYKNGEICNGADDNASGSTALIEIARILKENQSKLKRSVIIAAFDGEEKGLFTLMDAWERVRPAGWRLKLAGPDWDGFAAKLRRRAAAFADSVEFVGEAGSEEKDRLYREADLFVLPSPMENFSAVVLEALSYATPVICTMGTPWQAVEERRCGWRVEPDSADALADALAEATSISDVERAEMGARGRELAAERFSWQSVERQISVAMQVALAGAGMV